MAEKVSGSLAMRITMELRKRDMNVTDFVKGLANRYGGAKIPGYNHILRVCKGETFPGPKLLPILCEFLGIELQDARQMVVVDKSITSGAAQILTNKDPQLLRFETLWKKLSDSSKNELVKLAQMKAEVDITS